MFLARGSPVTWLLLDVLYLLDNLNLWFDFEHFLDQVLKNVVFVLDFKLLNLL